MTEEFYPMPLFVRMFVLNVAATAKWYANALGFRSVYVQQGHLKMIKADAPVSFTYRLTTCSKGD